LAIIFKNSIFFNDTLLNYTTQHDFFSDLNSTIFHRFSAANYDFVLIFFPARLVSEKIFNESSKSTENVLIDSKKYFSKSKGYVVSKIISIASKTGFGMFLAHLVFLKSEKLEMH
jgi:hypothetical protein